MTAQLGCYLRYASACPGELGQLLDFALGPLLWLLCFHGAALPNLPPCLTSEPGGRRLRNLRVDSPRATSGFVQPLAGLSAAFSWIGAENGLRSDGLAGGVACARGRQAKQRER
jgi:hypothetical protein